MKKEIFEKFNNEIVSLDTIMEYLATRNPTVNRNTVIWTLNQMIKEGSSYRIGRGVYFFSVKQSEKKRLFYDDVKNVVDIIRQNFKYVDIVVSDSQILSKYVVQQPFSTIVKIEVNQPAVESVTIFLRKNGINVFAYNEVDEIEKYSKSSRIFVIDKIRYHNPIEENDRIGFAKLEKIMVDLVCDVKIYKQYQGWELENIYDTILEKNNINFSTIIKYASSRNKKEDVLALLSNNKKFIDFMEAKNDK